MGSSVEGVFLNREDMFVTRRRGSPDKDMQRTKRTLPYACEKAPLPVLPLNVVFRRRG